MKLLRILIINLAVLLGLAVLVELAFGEWLASHPLGRLAIPHNVKRTISAAPLYPGGGEFVYRRDAYGLRGSGVDPARIRILTLGGSTTNQLYLPEEATWQAVLERSLRRGGRDVVVANAGLDGQSTLGMIADLDLWIPYIPNLRPRVVLVYVGINDVYLQDSWRDSLRVTKLSRELEQRSALVHLWSTAEGSLQARRAELTHHAVDFTHAAWTDRPAQPEVSAGQQATALAAYKIRLAHIANRIEKLGAVPMFITQVRSDYRFDNGRLVGIVKPSGPNGVDQGRALGRINATTMDFCRERLVTCLDLASEVVFEAGDFYDYEHNTPRGAAKIGLWLAGKLVGHV